MPSRGGAALRLKSVDEEPRGAEEDRMAFMHGRRRRFITPTPAPPTIPKWHAPTDSH